MIISHKYRYLFVQLPHTGCTAIAKELRNFYDGKPIYRKHSTYKKFLRNATLDEKNYFVFSGIRSPIDECVSVFYKYTSNHEGYDNPRNFRENNGFVTNRMRKRFDFIHRDNSSFKEYFKRFYFLPYDNSSRLDHHQFDYVYRFENIREDFTKTLEKIDIEQIRPLPVRNKTRKKGRNISQLFTPDVRHRAVYIFSPFMQKWNYSFPFDTTNIKISFMSKVLYQLLGKVRSYYWTYNE